MSGGYFNGPAGNMQRNLNQQRGAFPQQNPNMMPQQGGRMNVQGGGDMNYPNPNAVRGNVLNPVPNPQSRILNPVPTGIAAAPATNEWDAFFSQTAPAQAAVNRNPLPVQQAGAYANPAARQQMPANEHAMKQMLANTLGGRGQMDSMPMGGMPGNVRGGGGGGAGMGPQMGGGASYMPSNVAPMQQRNPMMGNSMGGAMNMPNQGGGGYMGGSMNQNMPSGMMQGNMGGQGSGMRGGQGYNSSQQMDSYDSYGGAPMGGGNQYSNASNFPNDNYNMNGPQGGGRYNDYDSGDRQRGGGGGGYGQGQMGYNAGGAGGGGGGHQGGMHNMGQQQSMHGNNPNLSNPNNNMAGRFSNASGGGGGGGGGFSSNAPQGNFHGNAMNKSNFNQPSMPSRRGSKWSGGMENLLTFPVQFAVRQPPKETFTRPVANTFATNMKSASRQYGGDSSGFGTKPAFGSAGRPSNFSGVPFAGRAAMQPATVTAGMKRERSRSPLRSVSVSPGRRGAGKAAKAMDYGRSSPPRAKRGRSPPRNELSKPFAMSPPASGGRKPLSFANLTLTELVESYNLPSIAKNVQSCNTVDLYCRYPNLYVPVDFVDVKMDWSAINEALHYDVVQNLTASAPIVFENTPAAVVRADGSHSRCYSDMLEPPKFTYLSSNTANNILTEGALFPDRLVNTTKPIKFNAKVIICCGLKDPENDRIDNHLPRKLRMLCGRRKGSLLLLGSSWSRDLDGGDPLTDRSCLLNTARRAVYAQSLIDIARGDAQNNLLKLCEITYHRPKEEIKQKVYPEQLEVTVIYMYSLQSNVLEGMAEDDWEQQWNIFQRRSRGVHVGPMMSRDPDSLHDDLQMDGEYISDLEQRLAADKEDVAVAMDEEKPNESAAEEVAAETTVESTASPAAEVTEPAAETSAEMVSESAVESAAEVAVEAPPADESALQAVAAEETTTPAEAAVEPVAEAAPEEQKLQARALTIDKPEQPAVLICPMPLPQDVLEDATKKNDGLSLRMLPLSAILGYSQDDCSERMFETSLAGELAKTVMAISFANVVTDFLLANTPSYADHADLRVCDAIKKLRQMNAAAKAKLLAATAPVAAAVAMETAEADKAADAVKEEPIKEEPVAVNEAKEEELAAPAAVADNVVTEEAAVEETEAEQTAAMDQEESASSEEMHQAEAASEANGDAEAEHHHEEADHHEDATMSEDEARMWRRRFLAACRWFDTLQQRSLPSDVLQTVINMSSRNLRRDDVSAVAEAACGDGNERLRYEVFI